MVGSVDVGDDAVRHELAVLDPVCAVLGAATVVVAQIAVDQKDRKVDGKPVRHDARQTCASRAGK